MSLFVVPATRRNFDRTVRTPVALADLRGLSRASLTRARRAPAGVAAWGCLAGSKASTWEALSPGDWALFYLRGHFPVAGKVLLREHSPDVAERLWGTDSAGRTWEYMYLFDDLRWIDAPRRPVLEALTYKASFYPRGFIRVDRPLSSRYDSVEDMLDDLAAVGDALGRAVEAAMSTDRAAAAEALDPLLDRMSRKALEEAIAARTRSAPPRVRTAVIKRLARDRKIVLDLKKLYEGRCQRCGFSFRQGNGKLYCEVAHVRALATRAANLDTGDNLLVLCPNHHKMLDHGAMRVEYDPEVDELLAHEDGETIRMENRHVGATRR